MKKPIEMPIPTGMWLENAEVGSRVDLYAQFEIKGDGTMCIASIEGHPMPGYDLSENDQFVRGYGKSEFSYNYRKAMEG